MRKIWSIVPLKFRKFILHWGRPLMWVGAIAVSVHHIGTATEEALRTQIDLRDLNMLRDLRMCLVEATADVGTILSDGLTSTGVGLTAFLGYFGAHPWASIVLLFAIVETFVHMKKVRRWLRTVLSIFRRRRK